LGDDRLVETVLSNWRTAPVSDRLRAMLGFLEKLTLQPASVTAADVAVLRASGLSEAAIEDAIHVCVVFNLVDRIADALGFDVPGPAAFAKAATTLLRRGYA
jgi:uncharacterized peroxidase-related enzyme